MKNFALKLCEIQFSPVMAGYFIHFNIRILDTSKLTSAPSVLSGILSTVRRTAGEQVCCMLNI